MTSYVSCKECSYWLCICHSKAGIFKHTVPCIAFPGDTTVIIIILFFFLFPFYSTGHFACNISCSSAFLCDLLVCKWVGLYDFMCFLCILLMFIFVCFLLIWYASLCFILFFDSSFYFIFISWKLVCLFVCFLSHLQWQFLVLFQDLGFIYNQKVANYSHTTQNNILPVNSSCEACNPCCLQSSLLDELSITFLLWHSA